MSATKAVGVSFFAFRIAAGMDLERLLEIEKACFQFAEGSDFFSDGVVTAICETGRPSSVVGYIKTRRARVSVEIESIAIAERFRRMGAGRSAVDLAARLSMRLRSGTQLQSSPQAVHAWVWERNVAAQHFFAACGFRAVKVCREHYDACDDSAILFSKPLSDRYTVQQFPKVSLSK